MIGEIRQNFTEASASVGLILATALTSKRGRPVRQQSFGSIFFFLQQWLGGFYWALCFVTIRLWETGATCCVLETPFFCEMSEFGWCILWAIVTSYFFRDSMPCKNCLEGSDNFMQFGGLMHSSHHDIAWEIRTPLLNKLHGWDQATKQRSLHVLCTWLFPGALRVSYPKLAASWLTARQLLLTSGVSHVQ